MTEDELRQALCQEALDWQRTPWHHKAMVKGAGVDCAHLIKAVYVGLQVIPDFEVGDYPADFMMHQDEERFLGFVRRFAVQVEEPKPGDVVMYKVGRVFAHGGIVLEWPRIIHAFRKEGMVVQSDGTQGFMTDREHTFWSVIEKQKRG